MVRAITIRDVTKCDVIVRSRIVNIAGGTSEAHANALLCNVFTVSPFVGSSGMCQFGHSISRSERRVQRIHRCMGIGGKEFCSSSVGIHMYT